MQTDFNKQFEKHASSIRLKRDLLSIANISIFPPVKQDLPRVSTERGMQIDRSEQFEKHVSSIRVKFDADSKTKVSISFRRHITPEKHDFSRFRTVRGMQMRLGGLIGST
jgi:hypothetical protein